MEIDRIAASHARFGSRFLNRIYTASEQAYCLSKKQSAESLAARFAAKEAAAKALGTGISYGVAWPEIEVVRLRSGKPTLQLHGRAAALAERMGVVRMHLSLTHSRSTALAVVVFEDEAGGAAGIGGPILNQFGFRENNQS
jgi:holo-[acyl-carrier protein] synthase